MLGTEKALSAWSKDLLVSSAVKAGKDLGSGSGEVIWASAKYGWMAGKSGGCEKGRNALAHWDCFSGPEVPSEMWRNCGRNWQRQKLANMPEALGLGLSQSFHCPLEITQPVGMT